MNHVSINIFRYESYDDSKHCDIHFHRTIVHCFGLFASHAYTSFPLPFSHLLLFFFSRSSTISSSSSSFLPLSFDSSIVPFSSSLFTLRNTSTCQYMVPLCTDPIKFEQCHYVLIRDMSDSQFLCLFYPWED